MGSEGSDSSVKPPMYFRRQSPRQAERNKQRAVDYKNSALAATTPQQKEDTNTCMSKKRKINAESPETLAIPAALVIKTDAGGVFVIKVKLLSSKTEIST